MFPMFINGFGVDKNIFNVNNGEMTKGVEDIIHNVLEFTRGILETKKRNIPLIMSKMGDESNFVLISFTDLDLLEPGFHIEFRK